MLAATSTTSGVRVSCMPRSTPVAASTTSIAGMPGAASSRYVPAWSATSSGTANRPGSTPDVAASSAASTAPMNSASQVPANPSPMAPRRSPAPSRRPTMAVVPYARNTQRPTTVWTTVAATASAASGVVPRWPTTAVSARRNNGSLTRAANAGTASRSISRSSSRYPWPPHASPSWLCSSGENCHMSAFWLGPRAGCGMAARRARLGTNFLGSTRGGRHRGRSERCSGRPSGSVHSRAHRLCTHCGALVPSYLGIVHSACGRAGSGKRRGCVPSASGWRVYPAVRTPVGTRPRLSVGGPSVRSDGRTWGRARSRG